ncbi:hypothetical protein O7627_13970 [Solwaraspora sp. WMMD1047]|uniref:hypothetical protein n=1 Tax=Solwaraspora sp. WMMD1047 TaxID=3016102 RepID=UPI002415AF52|nr:hypothetical protein [Solwaraspora sp. WMMD1047]MDG4830407.1 hypothetical protein [Solwaraspora sp. WMMD1047]
MMDVYRSAETAGGFAASFTDGMRSLARQGKPVAITEFGSATYGGAGDRGTHGLEIVEYDERGGPVRLDGEYARDEAGQAAYLRELLAVFDAGGVDAAFVFIFALYDHPAPPHRRPPRRPGPRQLRHREGPRRPARRHLPGPAVGAQGRVRRPRRLLPAALRRPRHPQGYLAGPPRRRRWGGNGSSKRDGQVTAAPYRPARVPTSLVPLLG